MQQNIESYVLRAYRHRHLNKYFFGQCGIDGAQPPITLVLV